MRRWLPIVLRVAFFSLPLWALMILLRVLFIVAGYALIPWQSAYTVVDGNGRLQFRARWMWPWGNKEDGIDGLRGGEVTQAWWTQATRGLTVRERIFAWSAQRNRANNLRYVPVIAPKFDVDRIHYVGTGNEPPDGKSGWAYCWQGLYTGYYRKTPRWWLWIGWKFKPSDSISISSKDTRLPRCDFALQLQRVRQ